MLSAPNAFFRSRRLCVLRREMEVNLFVLTWATICGCGWMTIDMVDANRWIQYGPLSKVSTDDVSRLRRPSRAYSKLIYYRRHRHHRARRHKGFRPTDMRCCQVGSKMARKGIDCHVDSLDLPRQRRPFEEWPTSPFATMTMMQVKDLSQRLGRCNKSPFARHLNKCCFYGRAREKRLRECKRMRSSKKRRKCRQLTRLKYP